MKRIGLTLICFLWMLCPDGSRASAQIQVEDLVGKSYADRIVDLRELHRMILREPMDWDVVTDTLSGMRAVAARYGDTELRLEADLIEAWYDYNFRSRTLDKLRSVQEEAQKLDVPTITCRATFLLALHHWNSKEYESAFRWFLRLDEMLQSMDIRVLPDMGNMYMEIGNSYYHF